MRDALIIGSGAGGGALALKLSAAGMDVLVLEKGRETRREDYPTDEIGNFSRSLFFPPVAEEPHMLVHPDLAAPRPTEMGWIACCLGGGTVHMGAYLERFLPDDFQVRSHHGEVLEVADWPYSYDDLEPYYSQAEQEIGVSGDSGSNPFSGPRSRAYPMPPLDASPLAEPFDRAARKLGLHPFPTPRGINSRPYQGRPTCTYCERCSSYGCRVGARGTSQESFIRRARATGRCEVRTEAMVREVTVDETGRATGCVYLDAEGREQRVEARLVCVCCSAVESARLLLMSRSPRFPDGLANGSGRVGRHLQFHGTSIGQARFAPERAAELPFEDDNPFLLRSLMDWYHLPEDLPGTLLPKGGMLIFQKPNFQPLTWAKAVAQRESPTLWGAALKERLRRQDDGYRSLFFEIHHDFLPNAGTFVELDPEVKDRWGLPVARIHVEEPEHQQTVGRYLIDRGLEVYGEMGAESFTHVTVGGTATYLVHGTCRAGTDPETSVLDPWCRAHEVPNLYVVDGSFMPTSGATPPTLTIVANALRTAEHILERGRAGELG